MDVFLMLRYSFRWLGLSLIVLLADLALKAFIEAHADWQMWQSTLPFLRFHLTYNSGVAFSMFGGGGVLSFWLLSGFALLISGALIWLLLQAVNLSAIYRLGLALLLGGAAGNLIDRLHDGVVTDFIELTYGAWSWPVFNLADVCITMGVCLWLFDMWREERIHVTQAEKCE